MEHNRKQELAFLYLQGTLDRTDKRIVFDLILHDDEFRRCLKEEVEMRERMKHFRSSMDPVLKQKLFAAIRNNAELKYEKVSNKQLGRVPQWLKWSEWALRLTLPPIVFPIMKQLQRRIFV